MRVRTFAMIPLISMCLACSSILVAQPHGLGVKTIDYSSEVVGALAGTVVRDGTTEALPRVQVKVFRVGHKKPLATRMTDREGKFRFGFEPGKYRLRFFLLGFDVVEVEVKNTGTGKPGMRIDLPMGT